MLRSAGVGVVLGALCACSPTPDSPPPGLADAHLHLSLSSAEALEALAAAGVTMVRDCGGEHEELRRWRDDIAAGRRQGPRLLLAGPMLDGPKPDARFRLTVTTEAEAERAVDMLAEQGVDFIKTHNAVPPAAFFAIVRRAAMRGLKVAAHLPRGVSAWDAADAGVGSIEHPAESLMASPISAGAATDVPGAVRWWNSPDGETAVQRLGRSGVTLVPTLVRYEALISAAESDQLRAGREALLPDLLTLVGRLHRAGVPILAGSDLPVSDGESAAAHLQREIALLQAAGLPSAAARRAASPEALQSWFGARRASR